MQVQLRTLQTKIKFRLRSLVTSTSPESGFRSRFMAAPNPNARSTEDDNPDEDVDRAHNLIVKCIRQYMDRNETAHTLEVHFGINHDLTRLVWDRLEEDNQEFFQDYNTKLVLKQQTVRFIELLEQQHRAMNIPLVPAEQQMPTELAETAPRAENGAKPDKLPANPIGSVGSEEVAGSGPSHLPGGSLARSPLEGQGLKTTAALDAAHMPISEVQNLIAGGSHSANFRGPAQPSSSMAGSLSHLDSDPEASDQKDLANLASDQGSPSADL